MIFLLLITVMNALYFSITADVTMTITLRLRLPMYLRQWFVHRMGGTVPVELPKGSAYCQLLRMFLRPKSERDPARDREPDADEGTVEIVVPSFPGKRPEIYNYLSARAREDMVDLIRDAFDLQLWSEFVPMKASSRRAKDILMTWMEENGIEVSDRNYEAVLKRLKILRRRESYRESKTKTRRG